jgi:hypothetical protein
LIGAIVVAWVYRYLVEPLDCSQEPEQAEKRHRAAEHGREPPDESNVGAPTVSPAITRAHRNEEEQTVRERRIQCAQLAASKQLNVITGLAALAAVGGLFFLYFQLQDGREIFEASQRPYVSIGDKHGKVGEMVFPDDRRDEVDVRLHFHNAGRLPALRFNLQVMKATGITTEQHMLRMTDSSERMIMYMAGMTTIGGDSEIDQIAENWGDRATIEKALDSKAP